MHRRLALWIVISSLLCSTWILRLRTTAIQEWKESSWLDIKPSKHLKWVECYPGFQCARLQVPLHYSNRSGGTAAIALVRLRANVSESHPDYRGPVLFNPGGPGGSGVDLIGLYEGKKMREILGGRFDIVGFDPRGVARSTPRVSFYESRIERALWSGARYTIRELNHSSDTVESVWAESKITGELAAKRDKGKEVLKNINTEYTARDMLEIVKAHGREKLQYWGFSYGTVLGSTFAAMFPDKIERMVLDGVVDVSDDYYTGQWTTSLRDTSKALQRFFTDCLAAGPHKCSFHEPSIDGMSDKLNLLYNSIIQSPIPVHTEMSYGLVDYARLRFTIFKSLYEPFEKWATLARGLQDLVDELRNGTVLYRMMEEAPVRCECDPCESRETVLESVRDAQTAIICNDADEVPSSLKHAREHYAKVLEVSEWGSLWAGFRVVCGGWPKIPKAQFRGPIAANTSFPLLIIGNAADPVTPMSSAHKLSRSFPGSVVLLQDSAGHTSTSSPSACTARNVRDYFDNGTMPEDGTWCAINGSPFDSKSKLVDPESINGPNFMIERW
ncbi:hypothetical protein PQX77_005599 [Marasmius sp. AFHP31]|nr:hypothetical protein PQX77_005599 [Marasmius sp. AFHP31]